METIAEEPQQLAKSGENGTVLDEGSRRPGFLKYLLRVSKDSYRWSKQTAIEHKILAKSIIPPIDWIETKVAETANSTSLDVSKIADACDDKLEKMLDYVLDTKKGMERRMDPLVQRLHAVNEFMLRVVGLQLISRNEMKMKELKDKNCKLGEALKRLEVDGASMRVEIEIVRKELMDTVEKYDQLEKQNRDLELSLRAIKGNQKFVEHETEEVKQQLQLQLQLGEDYKYNLRKSEEERSEVLKELEALKKFNVDSLSQARLETKLMEERYNQEIQTLKTKLFELAAEKQTSEGHAQRPASTLSQENVQKENSSSNEPARRSFMKKKIKNPKKGSA